MVTTCAVRFGCEIFYEQIFNGWDVCKKMPSALLLFGYQQFAPTIFFPTNNFFLHSLLFRRKKRKEKTRRQSDIGGFWHYFLDCIFWQKRIINPTWMSEEYFEVRMSVFWSFSWPVIICISQVSHHIMQYHPCWCIGEYSTTERNAVP